MSEPLTGDMREFGFSESAPAEAAREAEEALAAAETEEEEPEEPQDSPEEALEASGDDDEGVEEGEDGEDDQEAAEPSPEDVLAKVTDFFSSQTGEAEAPRSLTQEDIDKALDERLAQMAKPADAAAPEAPQEDLELKAFARIYAQAEDEEERAGLLADFQQMREKKLLGQMESKLAERDKASRDKEQLSKAHQTLKMNLDWGLRAAMDRGGLIKAVAEQFVQSGDYTRLLTSGQFGQSYLSQVFANTPGAMHSGQSVVLAAFSAKALVEDGYQQAIQQPQPNGQQMEAAEPRPVASHTTAIPSKASPQPQKKKKQTPEEVYANSIVNSGAERKNALPFMGY